MEKESYLISLIISASLKEYLKTKSKVVVEVGALLSQIQKTKSFKPCDNELLLFNLVAAMDNKYGLDLLEKYIKGIKVPQSDRIIKDKEEYRTTLFNEAILEIVKSRLVVKRNYITEYEEARARRIKDITSISSEKSMKILVASLGVILATHAVQTGLGVYPLSSSLAGIDATDFVTGASFYIATRYIAPKYLEKKMDDKLKLDIQFLKDNEVDMRLKLAYFYENERSAVRIKPRNGKFELTSSTDAEFKKIRDEKMEFSPMEKLLLQNSEYTR